MDVNSAHALGALYEINRKEAEKKEERQRILQAGAEASAEQSKLMKQQNELLEQQLIELKEKNSLLKDLYDRAKLEAEANAKEARRNRIFGWISFAVGTIIGIAGIVFGGM